MAAPRYDRGGYGGGGGDYRGGGGYNGGGRGGKICWIYRRDVACYLTRKGVVLEDKT